MTASKEGESQAHRLLGAGTGARGDRHALSLLPKKSLVKWTFSSLEGAEQWGVWPRPPDPPEMVEEGPGERRGVTLCTEPPP